MLYNLGVQNVFYTLYKRLKRVGCPCYENPWIKTTTRLQNMTPTYGNFVRMFFKKKTVEDPPTIYLANCDLIMDKRHKFCTDFGRQLVLGKFGKEDHWLCLRLQKLRSSPLVDFNTRLILDPSEDTYRVSYNLEHISMAFGFPVEDPTAGTAEGYLGDDNHFYGVLHLGNRSLHADPYGKDQRHKHYGPFESEYEPFPFRSRRQTQTTGESDHENGHRHTEEDDKQNEVPFYLESPSKLGVARSRICEVLLLADKRYFELDANSSLDFTVRKMVHAVAQADIIFRNTDFNSDGIPDNIGFSIKYIIVLLSNETNERVFGYLSRDVVVEGRAYLMKFARLRRLSEVCLGIAFSGHAFHNRTLGLSFTSLGGGMGGAAGGLCDRRAYGYSFNTLALSHGTEDNENRVPERIAALTLAHEMGHSFGAHHDELYPAECHGYLMGSQSTTADTPSQFQFSPCSKKLISDTLSSMSYCLIDERKPYCGNGIVEEGESCDCGLPSRCPERDPCCTPRAGGALLFDDSAVHIDGCTVAPNAQCHPSQGLCCTNDCKFSNLTNSGIECSKLDSVCSCANMSSMCECGLGGRCLPDGTCHAAECARLGLKECACPVDNQIVDAVSEAGMCGVCCVYTKSGKDTCMSSEYVAKQYIESNGELPAHWPDTENYNGPTVPVTLCESCVPSYLRAWPSGGACVVNNSVGVCTSYGVCTNVIRTPRTNVFPNNIPWSSSRRFFRGSSSASKIQPTLITLTMTIITIILYFYVL